MPRFLLPLLCLTVPALFAAPAAATDEDAKAEVSIVSAERTVRPGQTVAIGVVFEMQPGWHIYWKHPGDSGMPPTFNWNLPGGGASAALRGSPWTVGETRFPTPVRFVDDGGLTGYGYEGKVIFPFELRIPGSATPGQSAEVTLVVDYLICKDVCLPEQATVTFEFQVGLDDEGDGTDRDDAARLEEAARRLPVAPSASRHVTRVESHAEGDGRFRIEATLAGGVDDIDVFPAPPAGVAVEAVEVEKSSGKAVARFRVRPLGNAPLSGRMPVVIGFETPDGRRGVETSVELGR